MVSWLGGGFGQSGWTGRVAAEAMAVRDVPPAPQKAELVFVAVVPTRTGSGTAHSDAYKSVEGGPDIEMAQPADGRTAAESSTEARKSAGVLDGTWTDSMERAGTTWKLEMAATPGPGLQSSGCVVVSGPSSQVRRQIGNLFVLPEATAGLGRAGSRWVALGQGWGKAWGGGSASSCAADRQGQADG